MKSNRHPEYDLQSAFVLWLKLKHPRLRIAVSPAAGFKLPPSLVAKMKAMGYQTSTPDLIILKRSPDGEYSGLAIELKAPGKKASPEQVDYLKMLAEDGYCTRVCDSLEGAKREVENYLAPPF